MFSAAYTAFTDNVVWGATGNAQMVLIEKTTLVVNTAGTLQLRYAQGTSDGTPSGLLAGSLIEARRIS